MKLSDFPPDVQARIRAQLADDLCAVPAAQPERRGRCAPAPPHGHETRSPRRLVVSLISLRHRTLDDDNYVGACKHLRDAIAASLGFDDGDKRISWQYQQLHSTGREGVLVHIEVL